MGTPKLLNVVFLKQEILLKYLHWVGVGGEFFGLGFFFFLAGNIVSDPSFLMSLGAVTPSDV